MLVKISNLILELNIFYNRITKFKCHRTTNARNIVSIQGGGSSADAGGC